jgi:acetate kinase
MGWTPLEGVPMATRAGSVDPGILLRAASELPSDALADALNHDAGLLALAPATPTCTRCSTRRRAASRRRGRRPTSSCTASPRRWRR